MPCLESLVEWMKIGPARAFGSYYRIPASEMEDLVQDALVAYIHQEARIESAKAWLAVALRNRCLLYLRTMRYSRNRSEAYGRVAPTSIDPVGITDLVNDLEGLQGTLPPKMRRVIELTRNGLTTAELKQELGETEWNVRKLRTRAIARMRDTLAAGTGACGSQLRKENAS